MWWCMTLRYIPALLEIANVFAGDGNADSEHIGVTVTVTGCEHLEFCLHLDLVDRPLLIAFLL